MRKNTKTKEIRRYVKARIAAFFNALFYYTIPTYHIAVKNQKVLAKVYLMLHDLRRQQLPMDNKERVVNHDGSDNFVSQVKLYEFASSHLKDGDEVLDIACGIGYGSHLMGKKKKVNITGVDISENAIQHAKKHYRQDNIEFICSRAENFEPKKKFDVIVNFETLDLIEDGERFIQNITKHLKKGGIFLGSTANEKAIPYSILTHPFHYRHYTRRQASRLFRKSGGLKVENIYTQRRSYDFEITKSRIGFLTIHVARKI